MLEKRLPLTSSADWILLPLRLFLGITFIYAGIQKLADPQFFDPQKAGYIGKQLAGYATASPLKEFLLHVAVPHAQLFGFLVAFGEIAIGAGTLIGLLVRPAAFFGALLSLVFFLSATWRVYPYFFGSDIVFVFAWLTLFLNGPSHTGLPTIDERLFAPSLQANNPQQSSTLTRIAMLTLGIRPAPIPVPVPNLQQQKRGPRRATIQQARSTRRGFLMGLVTGGVGAFGLAAIAMAARILNTQAQEAPVVIQQPTATTIPTQTTPQDNQGAQATPTTAPTDTPASPNKIAQVSAVANNSSVPFTINSTGEAGMLIRLPSGKFVAYDLRCTHAGCQVDYDPQQHLLVCPCHGAEFDPAQQANPVAGPADTPLTPVTIHIDSNTGIITQA